MMNYNEHKCAVCGTIIKRMYWDEYIYTKKIGKHNKQVFFCGWNCMRQYEKEREEKKRHGKSRHNSNNTEA